MSLLEYYDEHEAFTCGECYNQVEENTGRWGHPNDDDGTMLCDPCAKEWPIFFGAQP